MANRVRTVFANMSWMLISQVIASVLAFIWTLFLSRYLGPSEYGIYGTAISLTGILACMLDVGFTTYVVRSISVDLNKESEYLNNTFSLSLLLSVLYAFSIIAVAFVLGWNNYIILICFLFAIQTIIVKLNSILYISFQVHEQMKYQALANIITSISSFLLILFVVFTPWGLTGVSLVLILSNILSFVYVLISINRHFIKLNFSLDFNIYKILIKGGIPFAIMGIFYSIYYSIDIIMITQFVGTYDAGLYNAAYRLIAVLSLFYLIYANVVFPIMSKLFKDNKDSLKLTFEKSVKYFLLIFIPLAVFISLYSYDIIIIFGSEFVEAGGVLRILIWSTCLLFINGPFGLMLNASNKEHSSTIICVIAAIFNVLLNLVLIPNYSVYGASVATVLGEALILCLSIYVVNKINQLPSLSFIKNISKIIFASAILAIVLYFLNINMWLAIPVSIVVYFAAIILFKTIDEEDKQIIKQILNR